VVVLRAGSDDTLKPVSGGDASGRWTLAPHTLAAALPHVRTLWPDWSDADDAVVCIQSTPAVNVRLPIEEQGGGFTQIHTHAYARMHVCVYTYACVATMLALKAMRVLWGSPGARWRANCA
jgi:hypothetical protein